MLLKGPYEKQYFVQLIDVILNTKKGFEGEAPVDG